MEIKVSEGNASIIAHVPIDWAIMEENSHPVLTPNQKLQILVADFRDKIARRSKSERFIQSEGTFDEVENLGKNSTLENFADELGLRTWPQIDRLLNRLELLRTIAPDEGEPLKFNCIVEFLQFLAAHSWARYPQLTITPRGTLRAEWRAARNKHFASEFLGNGQCGYVLFANDLADPEMIARFSGIVSIKSLLESIKPHDVLAWTQDGE